MVHTVHKIQTHRGNKQYHTIKRKMPSITTARLMVLFLQSAACVR
ncbi:hypothetical protein ACHAXS_013697, partial [Conticribra weissflogii]